MDISTKRQSDKLPKRWTYRPVGFQVMPEALGLKVLSYRCFLRSRLRGISSGRALVGNLWVVWVGTIDGLMSPGCFAGRYDARVVDLKCATAITEQHSINRQSSGIFSLLNLAARSWIYLGPVTGFA